MTHPIPAAVDALPVDAEGNSAPLPPPAIPWPDTMPASLETLNAIAHEFAHEP